MADPTAQQSDKLSGEDLAALTETYRHLRDTQDPRADKVGAFIRATVQSGNFGMVDPKNQEHVGYFGSIGSDLLGMFSKDALKETAINAATFGIPVKSMAKTAAQLVTGQKPDIQQHYEQQKQAGYSLPYRALSPVAENVGTNVTGMEEKAQQGDIGGVLGHASTPIIVGAATAGLAKGLPKAIEAVKGQSIPPVARYNIPEAANLPVKAISGAEDIFRASAPTGGNPQFRANLYAAAGDLAEIGRKTQLAEAKGGIIRPDMRVRATVDALNNHLQEMYQTERAPQIARNAEAPVAVKINGDAATGLDFLAKNAGTEADRALAVKASSAPALTIAETDQLARLTNKQLLDFESMTPSERATVEGSNRKLASLKALDQTLTSTLNDQLTMRGETGVQAYERRYAALSQVRDQLQSRMNAVELNQPGIIKKFGKTVGSVVTGSKSGIASASQAAVADVNIGRSLERGLKNLADSGIEPQRSGAMPTKRIAGQLPAGTAELPSSMEPIMPSDTMQTVKRVVRDPKTGKMKIQYVTGNQ